MAMETYATWARLFELQRYYSWIVDRFHLSTRMYQLMARGKDYDFRWLEERLLPPQLPPRLLHALARFLRRRPRQAPQGLRQARPVRRPLPLRPRAGRCSTAVGESLLPVLKLDVSDNDIRAAADRVADWLEATGGLTLD